MTTNKPIFLKTVNRNKQLLILERDLCFPRICYDENDEKCLAKRLTDIRFYAFEDVL